MAKINQTTLDKVFVLLASWGVFRQKSHTYHWNVIGQNFNPLHAIFNELYDGSVEAMDEIAERVRQLGKPVRLTLGFTIENSVITDINDAAEDKAMVNDLITSMAQLSVLQTEIYMEAEEQGDSVTLDLVLQWNKWIEKKSWFLSSWMGKENDSMA